MGMTMTQKILAKAAGLSSVQPGQLIEARLNLVLGNDITTPVAITEFELSLIHISSPAAAGGWPMWWSRPVPWACPGPGFWPMAGP